MGSIRVGDRSRNCGQRSLSQPLIMTSDSIVRSSVAKFIADPHNFGGSCDGRSIVIVKICNNSVKTVQLGTNRLSYLVNISDASLNIYIFLINEICPFCLNKLFR